MWVRGLASGQESSTKHMCDDVVDTGFRRLIYSVCLNQALLQVEWPRMKAFFLILVAACVAGGARIHADEYILENGYVSLSASDGVIENLRVDPTGAGNYGPVLARAIYVGEYPQQTADIPYDVTEDTVTFKNVRVYSNPREVGVIDSDTAVRLRNGRTLGQEFTVDTNGMSSVSIRVPTWGSTMSAMSAKVCKDGPEGTVVAEKRLHNIDDNSWQSITFPAQDKGTYYIEISDPRGPVGWWTSLEGPRVGRMYENGSVVDPGARAFRAKVYDVFPAQVKISAVGPKLFASAEPDKAERKFKWRVVTPFVRDGYETRDPTKMPFSRFYSDTGQYMPIAQLKRRSDIGFGMKADKWVTATGNGEADVTFGLEDGTMDWEIGADALTLVLGRSLAVTVKSHPEPLPDYYPAFYSSDASLDRSLNSFFYDRAFSWPLGGVNADWFEWMALIHFWNYRPGSLEYWRHRLLTYTIGEDGYVYTWGESKGWPFPDNEKYDTRHFTTNPNFVLACYRYYAWTKDIDFLERNLSRIRAAMEFMLSDLGGRNGIVVLPDKDHGGTPDDVPSNYWDDLPFGGKSAYVNAYFYGALGAMASIESAVGNTDKAKEYNELRAKCHKAYNESFWNDAAGRYVGCIDENGVVRDYGFTYVNMEASVYGLPDKAQVERIYHWMEQERTWSGKIDTYSRFRFAPRANTIDCSDWWYLNGKAEIPSQAFDTHLENGGAILYTSGYDIMARAKHLGADNALRRLKAILARYEEPDRLCGGPPLRYREANGWQVGTDVPFPESGLVGASFLHAFLGIQATDEGLLITPNLPSQLEFAGVRNLHYRGVMLDVRVTSDSVEIECDDPEHKLKVRRTIVPGEGYLFTRLER